MTITTPFYIRRPDETIPDFVVRIKAEPPRGPLFIEPRPGGKLKPGRTGRPNGRPRGDAAVLSLFDGARWLSLRDIVERTGKAYGTVQQAVYRAKLRGVIERDPAKGVYRPVQTP